MEMWIVLGGIVLFIALIKKMISINIVFKRTSRSCSLKTKGEVIEIIKEPFKNIQGHGLNNYDCLYIPVIKYNINGLEYVKKLELGLPIQICEVGDSLDIYVDPDDPENICIRNKTKITTKSNGMFSYLILVFICLVVVISIVTFFLDHII